jgi:hypothetical protein
MSSGPVVIEKEMFKLPTFDPPMRAIPKHSFLFCPPDSFFDRTCIFSPSWSFSRKKLISSFA